MQLSILIEFLKGFLFGMGMVIGFVFIIFLILIWLLYKIKKKGKVKYEPRDLVQPFKDYLTHITDKGLFEECPEVIKIISELEADNLPDEIKKFNIKKDIELRTVDIDESNSKFKLEKIYKVTGKKLLK